MQSPEHSKTIIKKHGIGFKLTVIISLVLFTVFAIKSTYDGYSDYKHTISEHTDKMTNENQLLALRVEQIFANAYQTYRDWDGVVQEELKLPVEMRSRERLKSHMQNFLDRNTDLASMGLLFQPDAFDEKDSLFRNDGFYGHDGRFTLYTQKTGSGITIRMVDEFYDTEEDAWWVEPLKHQKLVVIPPFPFDGKILVTLAAPIFFNGKAIGVYCTNLDVTSIQKRAESVVGTSKDNFKLFCTKDGVVVANGIDSSQVLKNQFDSNPEFKAIFEQLQSDKR